MFDLCELSMKFERGLESEAIDFCFLTEDWEKFVVLRDFRWMEFHTKHGRHYNMRMPLIGTCMCYNAPMCELYTGTIKNIVLRANLEQGRYFSPFETKLDYINSCAIDSTHLLTAFGGLNGVIECWDPREKQSIAKLDMYDSVPNIIPTPEISKILFGSDGITLCAGLSSGHVAVYDLRRMKPLHILNHRNKISIKDIAIHQQSSKIISCDSKTIRYWEQSTGELYTVITPSESINGLCIVPNSGVIFVAQEQHRMGSYYLPSVGIAPKWCPFLDNMTDELEENKYRSIFIDYKFITRVELEALGLEHLIGTNLLKPYMHGFFIDIRLYRRVRAIINPDAYEKYLKNKTKEKIEDKRSNRIDVKCKLPNVNRPYANHLMSELQVKKRNSNESGMNALVDPRFSDMFKNSDFVIDFRNDSYLNFHPEIKYAMDQIEYKQINEEDDFVKEDEKEMDDEINDGKETFDDKFLDLNKNEPIFQFSRKTQLPTLLDSDDDIVRDVDETNVECNELLEDEIMVDDGWNDDSIQGMNDLRTLKADSDDNS